MTPFTNIEEYDQPGEWPPAKTVAEVSPRADTAEQRIDEVSDGLDESDADSDLDEDEQLPWDDEGADDFYGDSDDD